MPAEDIDSMSLKKAQKWDLPCWTVCGECDYLGCSVCSLVSFCPWLAQGLNRSAALGSRCWLWSIVFIVFLMPIGFLWFGWIQKDDCKVLHTEKDDVYQDNRYYRLDYYCLSKKQFNLTAIAICIAATVIGIIGWLAVGWITRMHLRKKYNLPGHCCTDILLWFCCFPCALCQETRTIMKHKLQDKFHMPAGKSVPAARDNPVDRESVEDLPL